MVWLADSVHGLSEQFLVSDVVAGMGIASSLHDLTAKAFDFVSSHVTEIIVEHITSFELLAIDEERVRAR